MLISGGVIERGIWRREVTHNAGATVGVHCNHNESPGRRSGQLVDIGATRTVGVYVILKYVVVVEGAIIKDGV